MKLIPAKFSDLLCYTLASVRYEARDEVIRFRSECGKEYMMHHVQDCCEEVWIESIVGDLADLVGSPIIRAEEAVSIEDAQRQETALWTFYKLATAKGYVDIRWVGESSGYYSERVDFVQVIRSEVLEDKSPKAEPAPAADSEGWIEWDASNRVGPDLPPRTLVQTRLLTGELGRGGAPRFVGEWDWSRTPCGVGVGWYRIV